MAPYMPRVPSLERALERLGPDDGPQSGAQPFDLVHGINIALEWPLLAGWRYARRHRLPFVATPFVHVGERAVQRFYTMPHQLAALRDADRIIVQTDIEAREMARLGVSQQQIVRLGMGVDLDQVQGGMARFRAQHGIDGQVVTFMGAVTTTRFSTGALCNACGIRVHGDVGHRRPAQALYLEQVYDGLLEAHRAIRR
jgi:hypothetical protein